MKNNTKLGLNAVIITVITIVAVILFNAVISTALSKLPLKIDLTENKVYEISNYTKKVMAGIDEEITVYALYPANTSGNEYVTYAEEYLAKYEALSKNFKVTYIDPYNNPSFTKKYEDMGLKINIGSIILECGDSVETISMNDMYSSNQYSGETSIDLEKKLTAAIVNVTNEGGKPKVYFTEGHGEYQGAQLSSILNENGYECDTVNIAINKVPNDAEMLVIMSPTKDFTAEERDALDEYMDNGGKAMVVVEPGKPSLPRLDGYMAEWGITASGDYIIEGDANRAFKFQNGLTIPAPILAEHEITESLNQQKLVYMAPAASSLKADADNIRGAIITPLLTTSSKSWGKINLAAQTTAKEDGDNEGPLTVAALAEMDTENPGKMAVFGSLQAIELSGIMEETSYANGDLVLNVVAYLTERNVSMDIHAKVISAPRLTMSQGNVTVVWMLLQYILPVLVIAAGLIVWLKRRYK